jgi:hypothetical protein
MRKSLTDVYVRTVAPPPSGRLEVSDLRCVGLTFRITTNGAKTWSLRFRDPRSGRLTRATIGNYPEVRRESGLLIFDAKSWPALIPSKRSA